VSARYTLVIRAIATLSLVASTGCGRSSLRQAAQGSGIAITREPVAFTTRTFDPANPPADMPPLSEGEEAECDSNFLSSASVGGEIQETDRGHAWVTISQINVKLELNVTIWAPASASPHVIEHEDGHRQISTHYYDGAAEIARSIAAKYIGEKTEVTGTDLAAESNQVFQRVAHDITDEYNRELNPEPAQLLYDEITDHGRNEVVVQDAVTSAIKNTGMQPNRVAVPGN
jgi:hypothetical protein